MAELSIRTAAEADRAPILEIYNHYVRETPITFDLEPFSVEARRPWFEQFKSDGPHRLLVAEDGAELLGYACSHRFRVKPAYDVSVEATVYLHPERLGRGTGTRLYQALFDLLADQDVHRAYAGITLPNERSIELHERFGFRRVGVFEEVGRKFGRYWDVQWFEKRLESPGH